MEKIIFYLKSIPYFILEILFPSKCIGCNLNGEILCKNCINGLQRTNRETLDNILAIYDYQDPLVKKIIWKLKYHHSRYLGQKLGQILYSEMLEEISLLKILSLGSPIYVIPVPISNNRRRIRGYNQSEIIARSFCKNTKINILSLKNNIIYKNKNTIPQAKLTNRNRRLQNIKGAFSIKNVEKIKDRTIIIIDDVTTTGGTIMEIIKILKKSGAKKVIAFALAH